MHCWQLKLGFALEAVLMIKVLTASLHTLDVFAHILNPLCELLNSRFLAFTLFVELTLEVGLDHSLLIFKFLD